MKNIIDNHYFKLVISAIFAGIVMSLAAFELVVANKMNLFYAGGFVQGFGLLVILFLGLELYNTKLVSIFESRSKVKTLLDLLITLIINIASIIAIAVLLRVLTSDNAELMKSAKDIANLRVISIRGNAGKEWYDALIASLMCGLVVSIGVNIYKRVNNPVIKALTIFFAVGIYVACGFEQIMTNTFYITFADMLSGATVLNLFIVLVGNSFAAILVYFAFKVIEPIKKNN